MWGLGVWVSPGCQALAAATGQAACCGNGWTHASTPGTQGTEGSTVYDWAFDAPTGAWAPWTERVPTWEYPAPGRRVSLDKLVVPTVDSARYSRLISIAHTAGRPVLVRPRFGLPRLACMRAPAHALETPRARPPPLDAAGG